jgi:APA family basic amino acid/polyamine antiporter
MNGDPNSRRRKLGLTDTTLLVMGGIVGSGIFMNPHVVAKDAPSVPAILAAWLLGGAVALSGGFIWAELAARRPGVGGTYAYLRDGVHPAAGFLLGWSNLLVVQTGGMAAVAVTFARYAHDLAHPGWRESATAVAALILLTAVNLLGVRSGGGVQSAFMALKILAIAFLVACGLFLAPRASAAEAAAVGEPGLRAFFAAMIAVLFAYGGWATASFASGEIADAPRTLPRAMLIGTAGVVGLYLAVNAAAVRALGVGGLAASDAPASEVMRRALGGPGAEAIAAAIAISTFGFLAQGMLTCPRVYYAMAKDGLFFEAVGRLHPRTGVPHVAIVLQGVLACATALSGTYEEILSWVVTVDFAFLALTAWTLFAFRRREPGPRPLVAVPGDPWTTTFFIAASLAVVGSTFVEHPAKSLLGWALVATGLPAYLFWTRRRAS